MFVLLHFIQIYSIAVVKIVPVGCRMRVLPYDINSSIQISNMFQICSK